MFKRNAKILLIYSLAPIILAGIAYIVGSCFYQDDIKDEYIIEQQKELNPE